MTSQWYMNVNKARPRHAPTWRKAFKWTHFTTISKREWISTVIVYVYEVIWSIHFHSIKWNYDNRIGESPWRSWCYLICIITRGLCSYNARLFNDDVTAIGASYWRRREFPNYARLHRGRISIWSWSECGIITNAMAGYSLGTTRARTAIITFRPRQNGHKFPDDVCKTCIFLNEKL